MPPRTWWISAWLLLFALSAGAEPAPAPQVWIFNGTPGDPEHHAFYEANLARLTKVFQVRFGIPTDRITVLYGPKDAGYAGLCTREALLAELAKIVELTKTPNPPAVWLIFQGHANRIPGGANFNLPGPDVSSRDIGEALKSAAPNAPMVIIGTTTCSDTLIRPLAAPGRMVIAATTPKDPENETEFPLALVEALEATDSDSDRDGMLSVSELFLACHAHVQRIYAKLGFMIKEQAQLDGNGDGRGTQRPAPLDAEPASSRGLRIAQQEKTFE